MSTDTREFKGNCTPCTVAARRMQIALMHIREMPEKPWQQYIADYKSQKRPIGDRLTKKGKRAVHESGETEGPGEYRNKKDESNCRHRPPKQASCTQSSMQ